MDIKRKSENMFVYMCVRADITILTYIHKQCYIMGVEGAQ